MCKHYYSHFEVLEAMNAMKAYRVAFGHRSQNSGRHETFKTRTNGYARATDLSINVQLSLDKKETLALEIAFHTNRRTACMLQT